jgi:hypothetical protein
LTSQNSLLSCSLVLFKNYADISLVHCSLCYPSIFIKSPQILLCYLSVACSQFLACFTVQFSRCRSFQPSSRSE